MNRFLVRERFLGRVFDVALLAPLLMWILAVAVGLLGAYGLMTYPLTLLVALDLLLGLTVALWALCGAALFGLFVTRGRQRLVLSAHLLVFRDSLAFGLWFATLSLGLSGLLLGGCRSLIWFFGPYPWVAITTAMVFTCALPLSAGWIPLEGLPTLGLLWRTPMPSRKQRLLHWLGACLVLVLRYRQGRVADSEASRPVLSEITRTLDLARRGGSERGANLWDTGFAGWRAEIRSRLLALGWMALSAAVASGILFVGLPGLKILPPFQTVQTSFNEPESHALTEQNSDPDIPEWASQKPEPKNLPPTEEQGDASSDQPATHSGEKQAAGDGDKSGVGSSEAQTSAKEPNQGGEGEGQSDQSSGKVSGDSGESQGQGNQAGEGGSESQSQGNQAGEGGSESQSQGNQAGEGGSESQSQGNQAGEGGSESQSQGNQAGETGSKSQGQGNKPGESGPESQTGQGNKPGESGAKGPSDQGNQPGESGAASQPGPGGKPGDSSAESQAGPGEKPGESETEHQSGQGNQPGKPGAEKGADGSSPQGQPGQGKKGSSQQGQASGKSGSNPSEGSSGQGSAGNLDPSEASDNAQSKDSPAQTKKNPPSDPAEQSSPAPGPGGSGSGDPLSRANAMAVLPPPPSEGGELLTITVPIHQRSKQNTGALETASDSPAPADPSKKAAGSESGDGGAQSESPTSPTAQGQQPVQNLPNWIQILLQPQPPL